MTTTYREVRVADRWTVKMPESRVVAQNWALWERCRFVSMGDNLNRGDTLYDVGTEWGDISAVYAQMVGAENMVLMEPHPETWTIIKRTWVENGYALPRACWVGLVGDKTVWKPENLDFNAEIRAGWPECAYGEPWPHRSFRYIHEHSHSTPTVTIDDYVNNQAIGPSAVTIDVEGAELCVLRGMAQTLMLGRPLVWVSIHPDTLERDYHATREDLAEYMRAKRYRSTLLGVDHEEHWLFWPEERRPK